MTELEASGKVEHPPPYIIFVVVFLFFLTGLLGFLICHLLKKKGYRCRTGEINCEEEEEEDKLGGNADDSEENQDTVEQILKCIIENEANMEAFNEMLGNHNVCVRHDPRLRKESIGGIPSHHHTVHSGTEHNSCHLCAQVRSKKGRRQSRTPRLKQRPGEQTVFSVGRFRVTHHDKKLHGGPNPIVSSGDQLDQSQDSEDRKEGGYNLKNMFKDVRPPSESSSGVAPNVGKRRKSITLFGMRRGSDPAGIKVGEGTGRETGGVRFVIQQQPVVLEEQPQKESTIVANDCGTKLGIKSETKFSKNQTAASSQREAKTLGSVNSPPQSKIQTHDAVPMTEDGSKHEPIPDPKIKPFTRSTAAAPSSLPIPSSALSGQALKTMGKQGDVENMSLKNKEAYDPGPLQTSTPIAPVHGTILGFTSVTQTGQPESCSTGLPVTQTPPDPNSISDLETGFGANLALISLGYSPPSSFHIKTQSEVSLKTPTSPFSVTPSPKPSSGNTPTEATKNVFSLDPILSHNCPSGQAMSSQFPGPSASFGKSSIPLQDRIPSPALTAGSKIDTMALSSSSPADQNLSIRSAPHLSLRAESVTSVTYLKKGDNDSIAFSIKEQELDGARLPKAEEKTERSRVGILKTAKLSELEGNSSAFAFSSPTEEYSKDRLSSFPLPSSPLGSRISNVAIIKASPDSKREFSVVTMVEEEESSSSTKDQKRETSQLRIESGKAEIDSTVSDVVQPEIEHGENSATQDKQPASQEKDDMVEMEDIKDCKVTQMEETKLVDE